MLIFGVQSKHNTTEFAFVLMFLKGLGCSVSTCRISLLGVSFEKYSNKIIILFWKI